MFAGTSAALGMVASSAVQKASGPAYSFNCGPFPYFLEVIFHRNHPFRPCLPSVVGILGIFFFDFFFLGAWSKLSAHSHHPGASGPSITAYRVGIFWLFGAKRVGNSQYTGQQGCYLEPPQAEVQ